MKKGKLIVIEGTDCSGKETQSKLIVDRLKKDGFLAARISFPMYDSPTGKIIGACLLGKPSMCNDLLKTDSSFFSEGGGNIDPLTAINFYAADRRYNLPKINNLLDQGYIVLLDRYVFSNMAHRGGMITDFTTRQKMYKKIEMLEYEINELPRPDQVFLLHMPYENAFILKQNRDEASDETESNEKYLKNGEKAYLELAKLYNFTTISCLKEKSIRTIEDINNELYQQIKELVR